MGLHLRCARRERLRRLAHDRSLRYRPPLPRSRDQDLARILGEITRIRLEESAGIKGPKGLLEKLKTYAELFHAGPGWTFLTGDSDDLSQVYRAFDSFAGSKMNHQPLTLLKSPRSSSWTRIDGLANGTDLAQEVTARLLN